MKRIVISGPFKIEVEECPLPEAPESGILAEALFTGISAGTERIWYNGSNPAIQSGRRGYPYYPGYEFVGRVVETGRSVKCVRSGDLVLAMAPHASYAILDGTRPYAVVTSDFPQIEGVVAGLTTTAIHTLHRARVEFGCQVAVCGLGVLGMQLVQAARLAGAGTVIALNRSSWKLDVARRLGADLAISTADPSWKKQVLDATGGRGADVSIESTGTQDGMDVAIEAVRKRGRAVAAGFYTEPFRLSGEAVFSKELTLIGVRSAGGPNILFEYLRWNQFSNFQEAVRLLSERRIRGGELITHRFAATEIEKAYELINGGSQQFLQIVLNWT